MKSLLKDAVFAVLWKVLAHVLKTYQCQDFLTLTEPAATQIQEQLPEGEEGISLRLAVRKLEDGSFHYAMGFDVESCEGDQKFILRKIPVVVGADSLSLARGMTVDFVEVEPGAKRFIFLNPNDPSYVPPKE